MATFSERYGFKEVRTALQVEEMDNELRTDLWNVWSLLTESISGYSRSYTPYFQVWVNLWKKPVDNIPYHVEDMSKHVKKHILTAEWFEVYDLIETFIASHERWDRDEKIDLFNHILERNLSAFRFVDTLIVRIDEETDIEAIEQALQDAADLTGAKRHLQKALSHLSDRHNPDYANSVKESMSAVEAVCQHISGKKNATLGDGIKALKDKGVVIHPALERSWLAAYGYASDGDGIRHALSGESTADQARALYFLVTCSAFVSLLISQAATVGLVGESDEREP